MECDDGARELLDTLELILRRPSWQRDALCVEHPSVSFFPELGQTTGPAKVVCARCLCRQECLAWALDNDERGVWGGTSDRERQALRKAHEAA